MLNLKVEREGPERTPELCQEISSPMCAESIWRSHFFLEHEPPKILGAYDY